MDLVYNDKEDLEPFVQNYMVFNYGPSPVLDFNITFVFPQSFTKDSGLEVKIFTMDVSYILIRSTEYFKRSRTTN